MPYQCYPYGWYSVWLQVVHPRCMTQRLEVKTIRPGDGQLLSWCLPVTAEVMMGPGGHGLSTQQGLIAVNNVENGWEWMRIVDEWVFHQVSIHVLVDCHTQVCPSQRPPPALDHWQHWNAHPPASALASAQRSHVKLIHRPGHICTTISKLHHARCDISKAWRQVGDSLPLCPGTSSVESTSSLTGGYTTIPVVDYWPGIGHRIYSWRVGCYPDWNQHKPYQQGIPIRNWSS